MLRPVAVILFCFVWFGFRATGKLEDPGTEHAHFAQGDTGGGRGG